MRGSGSTPSSAGSGNGSTLSQYGIVRNRARRRQRITATKQWHAVAELMRGEHRLDVLLLVLLDHGEREELVVARLPERVEGAPADVGDEAAGLARGR